MKVRHLLLVSHVSQNILRKLASPTDDDEVV